MSLISKFRQALATWFDEYTLTKYYYLIYDFLNQHHTPLYSLGLVTYVVRYDQYFKPVIRQLLSNFPDTEIMVNVNGYYDLSIQRSYLIDINNYLKKHRNVKVISHEQPRSLSLLWNQIILKATNNFILILNDDISVSPLFRRELELKWKATRLTLLNSCWSHFIINKEMISANGWFDERFEGVGNEDEDYEGRMALKGLRPDLLRIEHIQNHIEQTKDFSYGKDTPVEKQKYVKRNKEFFDRKWELSEVGGPDYAWIRILQKYGRIRPGMETPKFYEVPKLTR